MASSNASTDSVLEDSRSGLDSLMLFVHSVKEMYSQLDSTPDWTAIYFLSQKLIDINKQPLRETQIRIFIKYLVNYIEVVLVYLSTNEKLSFGDQNKKAEQLMYVIPKSLQKANLRNMFVKQATTKIFDLFLYDNYSTISKKILFEIFITVIQETDKELVREIGALNKMYLYKLMDSLSTIGDYILQLHIMEVVFKLFKKDIRNLESQYEVIPGKPELSITLATDVSEDSFESDIRHWLNKFNTDSNWIFSISFKSLMFGEMKIENLEIANWIDFNLKDNWLAFHAFVHSQWNRVTFMCKHVSKVKIDRDEKFIILSMTLTRPCTTDTFECQKFWNSLDNNIRIAISNEEKDNINRLISRILPRLFKNSFEHTSRRISTNAKIYKPLSNIRPIGRVAQRRSSSSLSSDNGSIKILKHSVQIEKRNINSHLERETVSHGKLKQESLHQDDASLIITNYSHSNKSGHGSILSSSTDLDKSISSLTKTEMCGRLNTPIGFLVPGATSDQESLDENIDFDLQDPEIIPSSWDISKDKYQIESNNMLYAHFRHDYVQQKLSVISLSEGTHEESEKEFQKISYFNSEFFHEKMKHQPTKQNSESESQDTINVVYEDKAGQVQSQEPFEICDSITTEFEIETIGEHADFINTSNHDELTSTPITKNKIKQKHIDIIEKDDANNFFKTNSKDQSESELLQSYVTPEESKHDDNYKTSPIRLISNYAKNDVSDFQKDSSQTSERDDDTAKAKVPAKEVLTSNIPISLPVVSPNVPKAQVKKRELFIDLSNQQEFNNLLKSGNVSKLKTPLIKIAETKDIMLKTSVNLRKQKNLNTSSRSVTENLHDKDLFTTDLNKKDPKHDIAEDSHIHVKKLPNATPSKKTDSTSHATEIPPNNENQILIKNINKTLETSTAIDLNIKFRNCCAVITEHKPPSPRIIKAKRLYNPLDLKYLNDLSVEEYSTMKIPKKTTTRKKVYDPLNPTSEALNSMKITGDIKLKTRIRKYEKSTKKSTSRAQITKKKSMFNKKQIDLNITGKKSRADELTFCPANYLSITELIEHKMVLQRNKSQNETKNLNPKQQNSQKVIFPNSWGQMTNQSTTNFQSMDIVTRCESVEDPVLVELNDSMDSRRFSWSELEVESTNKKRNPVSSPKSINIIQDIVLRTRRSSNTDTSPKNVKRPKLEYIKQPEILGATSSIGQEKALHLLAFITNTLIEANPKESSIKKLNILINTFEKL
ncbi:hypothetical protein ABEB36_008956 [Hypothenemus hampei]|uniref:Synaptonemal complex protein 2 n=1 Tax=Hypothenemus hampei TaxID=57062 RepID=A0ABD1EPA6_HYPHA